MRKGTLAESTYTPDRSVNGKTSLKIIKLQAVRVLIRILHTHSGLRQHGGPAGPVPSAVPHSGCLRLRTGDARKRGRHRPRERCGRRASRACDSLTGTGSAHLPPSAPQTTIGLVSHYCLYLCFVDSSRK